VGSKYFDEDAFDDLQKDIIENQDLARAVEKLKAKIEGEEEEGAIHPSNIEQKLDSRNSTINDGLRQASIKSENVAESGEELEDRREEEDFRENYRDNAVDADDWDDAVYLIDQYEQLTGELVLLVRILLNDRELLREGIDIQEWRVEERKIYESTQEIKENAITQFQNMGNKLVNENAERMEQVMESRSEVADKQREAAEAMTELAKELKELRGSTPAEVSQEQKERPQTSDTALQQEEIETTEEEKKDPDPDDLSDFQRKIYELSREHPEWGTEKVAEELDQPKRIISATVGKIRNKDGFEDFSLKQETE